MNPKELQIEKSYPAIGRLIVTNTGNIFQKLDPGKITEQNTGDLYKKLMGQRLRITHDKKKSTEDQTFIMMLEKYVESIARLHGFPVDAWDMEVFENFINIQKEAAKADKKEISK